MIFHDVGQNTEEWYQLRSGKVTSSKLGVVMANFPKAFGDPAKKYAVDIAIERITGKPISSNYTNDHMARGHEEEPIARMLYEEQTFSDVENGGFFDLGDIGCSPDGLSEGGVIEIKSAIPSIHYKRIKNNKYDSAYKWQLIGNMKFTEKPWIDFVSYCSSFPEGKRLFVDRLVSDDYQDEFSMIDKRLEEFLLMVRDIENTIK